MKILNYKQSLHFEQRLTQRQIDPFLVSLCLIKGDIKKMKSNKIKYILNKEKIIQAIEQEYLLAKDCLGLTSLTVVTREDLLITAYAKFGDTGINLN